MKKQLALVAAVAALFAAGSANALIIDNFSDDQPDIVVTSPTPSSSLNNLQSGIVANIVGGYRETDVVLNSAADQNGDDKVEARVIGSGLFDVANTTGADATIVLTWDANGAGLGNINLTTGGATGIFMAFPTAIDNNLTIKFDLFDGMVAASKSITFPNGSVGSDFFFAFNTFTNQSSITSVDKIVMTLDSSAGWDARFDLIETRDAPPPPPGVPEPATLGLLGLGLLGLGMSRRKRA